MHTKESRCPVVLSFGHLKYKNVSKQQMNFFFLRHWLKIGYDKYFNQDNWTFYAQYLISRHSIFN